DCVLKQAGNPMPNTGLDILHDFIRNIRQNGRVTLEENEQITLNTERSRREIELLNHPAFRVPKDSSRPSLAHLMGIVTAEPIPDPAIISDSEAAQYLRQ